MGNWVLAYPKYSGEATEEEGRALVKKLLTADLSNIYDEDDTPPDSPATNADFHYTFGALTSETSSVASPRNPLRFDVNSKMWNNFFRIPFSNMGGNINYGLDTSDISVIVQFSGSNAYNQVQNLERALQYLLSWTGLNAMVVEEPLVAPFILFEGVATKGRFVYLDSWRTVRQGSLGDNLYEVAINFKNITPHRITGGNSDTTTGFTFDDSTNLTITNGGNIGTTPSHIKLTGDDGTQPTEHSYTDEDTDFDLSSNILKFAQFFQHTREGKIDIIFKLKRTGTPDGSLSISLQSDSAGNPDETKIDEVLFTSSDIGTGLAELRTIFSRQSIGGYWVVIEDTTSTNLAAASVEWTARYYDAATNYPEGPLRQKSGTGADYTLFSEVDIGADRVVVDSASKLTVTTIDEDEEVYVHAALDSSVTGNFTAQGSFKVTASSGDSQAYAFGYSDSLDDLENATSKAAIVVSNESGAIRVRPEDEDTLGGSMLLSVSTQYWWTFTRVGTTLDLAVFSDSGRITELGDSPVNFSQSAADTYDRIFGMSGKNEPTGGKSMSYECHEIENATGVAVGSWSAIGDEAYFKTHYPTPHTKNAGLYNTNDTDIVFRMGNEELDGDQDHDDDTSKNLDAANDWFGMTFQPKRADMQKIKLRLKKTGTPDSLRVRLIEWDVAADDTTGSDLVTVWVPIGDVSSSKGDVFIPLIYEAFDSTKTYLIYCDDADGDGSNFYTIYGLTDANATYGDSDGGRQVDSTDGGSNWTESTTILRVIRTYASNPVSVELLDNGFIEVNDDGSGKLTSLLVQANETIDKANTFDFKGVEYSSKWVFATAADYVIWKIEAEYPMRNCKLSTVTYRADGRLRFLASTDNSTYTPFKVYDDGSEQTATDVELGTAFNNKTTIYIRVEAVATDANMFISDMDFVATLDTDSAAMPSVEKGSVTWKGTQDDFDQSDSGDVVVYWKEQT